MITAVCNNAIPQAMLVGKARRRAASVVSFVNVPGPRAKVLEIEKGGRMGRPSAPMDKLLACDLLMAAKSSAVDSVCERLPLHSELFRQIQQLLSFLIRERVPQGFCYSVLSLTLQERKRPRLFSGKMQREIRRKWRIIERAFPNQLKLNCFSTLEELECGLCNAMRVDFGTCRYYLGECLVDTAQNGSAFAFLVGLLYDGTLYCQYAGYHPGFARFSVGSLLTARTFEDLAASGVHRVDLGEGGPEHIRCFGCQMAEEGTVPVYSSTLRGIYLNVLFGTTQLVRAGGRRARSGLRLNWAGRIWGRLLLARRRLGNRSRQLPSPGSRMVGH